ncbi:YlbF family regulator [Clostridium sp. D2Q-14]|uniref:YlbF family regulator n=1 Tax=Anaeromonas gelatinilytica TaxID=2683194 RepID=UPI00193C630D|nr:YlbF family regulator [Anaeromonas gelatinilytica]MBS4536628.1 YlbF family regulator [Anaeromonas gelatinilytica]
MSINKAINMLVYEIKSTREFQELKRAKDKLSNYESLSREIQSLQDKQIEIVNSKRSSKEKERKMMELNRKFEELSSNPEVSEMIKAGNKFNKMMSNVYKDLGKMLDSEF